MLDLEVHEVVSLFNLLDDGDGLITHDEFLNGVMRLKGHARSLDIIAISKDMQTQLRKQAPASGAKMAPHVETILLTKTTKETHV